MPGSKPRAAKCCIWGFISTEYELATIMVEKNTEVQRTEMSCSVPAPCPSGGSLSDSLHLIQSQTRGSTQRSSDIRRAAKNTHDAAIHM